MKELKKLFIILTSSLTVFALVGQAGAALKSSSLQIRSARLYHTYNVVLTQDSGTFSPPPSGDSGSFSPPPSGDIGSFHPPSEGSFSPPPIMTGPPAGDFGPPPMMTGPPAGDFGPKPGMTGPPPGDFGPPPGGDMGGQPSGPCAPNTPCGPQGQFGGQQGFGGEQGGDQGRKFQFNRGSQENQGGQGQQGGFGGEQGGMSEEEQEKFQQQQDARMLKDIKRGLTQMSRMLGPMISMIAKMEKTGVSAPQELKDTITKVSNLLTVVKSAKTMDEILAAGFEDLQDWMMTINEGRQLLEMAARWGSTVKQVDTAVKRLQSVLKKDQALAKRVKLDLSSQIADFEAAVNELVAARDRAKELAKSGDIEGAYNELEENFFNKMEDVMQHDQIIQTVSRLGKFESEFKRRYAQAQREINVLKRRKVDVTEMNALMAQIAEQGNEIKGLIKAQPLDQEAVFAALSSLEDLVQNLEELMDAAQGEKDELPWEQGKDQFRQVDLPSSVGNLFTPAN